MYNLSETLSSDIAKGRKVKKLISSHASFHLLVHWFFLSLIIKETVGELENAHQKDSPSEIYVRMDQERVTEKRKLTSSQHKLEIMRNLQFDKFIFSIVSSIYLHTDCCFSFDSPGNFIRRIPVVLRSLDDTDFVTLCCGFVSDR